MIQLKQKTEEWIGKLAGANKMSSFMNTTTFRTKLDNEAEISQQDKQNCIEDPIFCLEGGAIFRIDPITLPMVACAYVRDLKPRKDLTTEEKLEGRRRVLNSGEGQWSSADEKNRSN